MLSFHVAVSVSLSSGSAKFGLTSLSSRRIVRQGQTEFFAHGGFLPASRSGRVLLRGKQKNEEKNFNVILS